MDFKHNIKMDLNYAQLIWKAFLQKLLFMGSWLISPSILRTETSLKKILEVAYVCPVHGKAAVYSFEAKLEGRTITAHCLEKKKAQQVYSKAVKQGHTAILGSENDFSGDLLHLSLGNFPKGDVAELKLKMVMELPVGVDGAVTFTLPTIFNPRYCPADQETSYQFDGCMGSSHAVFPNQTSYSLDVKGEVRGSLKIAKVTSESDPVNVEISDEETTAVITQDGGSNLDHDWSFQVYYQTVHKAHALQMTGDRSSKGLMKNDVLMLNFFPEIPYECFNPHNELIFVVDRSGSMEGSSIEKAKSTLLLFLKSLPTGCRFNIISFGSSFSTLFQSSSERYTKNTLAAALRLQKSMDADMGGTEILDALKHVYSHDLIPGYARQMIVLTDGAVWNQSQIFDLVSQHADETRVFSVGIGDGASTALVQGIAEAGRGRYEMVVHNNQLQTKVMGLVASMLQDNVKDLRVNCELNPPQTHSLVPKIPPVVFGGQHLILYARVLPKTEIKSIKITGKIGEKELACEIGEKDCKIVRDSNFSFHRLAAKAQLKQWERDDTEGIQDDVIDLSVSSSVVCKATALVGIDQDGKIIKEEEQGPFEVNDSRMSLGYCSLSCDIEDEDENLQKKSPMGGRIKQLCSTLMFKSGKFSMSENRASIAEIQCSENEDRFVGGPSNFINKSPTVDVEEEKNKKSVEDFLSVVSCQNFDGSWDLNDCLKFVKAPNDQIKNIQSELSLDDKCFATVLILAFLEIQFSSRKQEWHLLHIKGRIYLESKTIEATKVIEECSRQLQKILQITS